MHGPGAPQPSSRPPRLGAVGGNSPRGAPAEDCDAFTCASSIATPVPTPPASPSSGKHVPQASSQQGLEVFRPNGNTTSRSTTEGGRGRGCTIAWFGDGAPSLPLAQPPPTLPAAARRSTPSPRRASASYCGATTSEGPPGTLPVGTRIRQPGSSPRLASPRPRSAPANRAPVGAPRAAVCALNQGGSCGAASLEHENQGAWVKSAATLPVSQDTPSAHAAASSVARPADVDVAAIAAEALTELRRSAAVTGSRVERLEADLAESARERQDLSRALAECRYKQADTASHASGAAAEARELYVGLAQQADNAQGKLYDVGRSQEELHARVQSLEQSFHHLQAATTTATIAAQTQGAALLELQGLPAEVERRLGVVKASDQRSCAALERRLSELEAASRAAAAADRERAAAQSGSRLQERIERLEHLSTSPPAAEARQRSCSSAPSKVLTIGWEVEEQLRCISAEVSAVAEQAMSTYVDAARLELSARIEALAKQCSDAVRCISTDQAERRNSVTLSNASRGPAETSEIAHWDEVQEDIVTLRVGLRGLRGEVADLRRRFRERSGNPLDDAENEAAAKRRDLALDKALTDGGTGGCEPLGTSACASRIAPTMLAGNSSSASGLGSGVDTAAVRAPKQPSPRAPPVAPPMPSRRIRSPSPVGNSEAGCAQLSTFPAVDSITLAASRAVDAAGPRSEQ